MISAPCAVLHGFDPPLQPSEAVEATRATLPAVPLMLIGAGAVRLAVGKGEPVAPPASLIRKYLPGSRETSGSTVIWLATPKLPVPVALAYWTDLPASGIAVVPRL